MNVLHGIELPPAAEGLTVFNNASDIIEGLQMKLLDLVEEANNIQAAADADGRDFTEEEQEKLDKIFDEQARVEDQISYRNGIEERKQRLATTLGRKTQPEGVNDEENDPVVKSAVKSGQPARVPRVEGGYPTGSTRGSWGFRSFGEYAMAVRMGVRGNVDPRLVANAPSTYSTEGTGADGGFAVPPEFRTAIVEKVMAEDSLLGRTDTLTTASNSITIPVDETTPWQTTGGVQAYWEGEASQYTQSKLALQNTTVRLNKLTAMVPVSEELLEDASTLDGFLRRKVPEKFDFSVALAIVQGNGVGRPQGILNSDCLVTVAKETSQPADTILAANIQKMYSRMYAPCRPNGVWLINQDVEQQLMSMFIPVTNVAGSENVGGMPVYVPPGGLSAAPYGTLLGRPVIPTQACETLGDKGDIIFADLSKYLSVVKAGGVRADISMHLWFDYDMTAYRFTFRVGGQPWWSSSISPRDGSNTLSCFVTLAERA